MKRFTQKFFLLAIGMLLSVGASAQGEGTPVTVHRFPAVEYQIKASNGTLSETYVVPAWDVRIIATDNKSGALRLQKKMDLGNKNFTALIVTRYSHSKEGNVFKIPAATDDIVINGDANHPIKANQLKYSHVVTAEHQALFPGTDYADYEVMTLTTTGSNYQITEDNYSVPTELTDATHGHFSIDEVGRSAYRNYDFSPNNSNWFRAKHLTIPAGIKKIDVEAFMTGADLQSITIENGGITRIPQQAFMNCVYLKEIKIPASVTYIGGAALGGCTNLGKIDMTGCTSSPELDSYDCGDREKGINGVVHFVHGTGSRDNLSMSRCAVYVDEGKVLTFVNDPVENSKGWWKKFLFCSPFTMSKDMISYYSPYYLTIRKFDYTTRTWIGGPREDLKAYYVMGQAGDGDKYDKRASEGKVLMKQITESHIPKEFGLILKGNAGTYDEVFFPPETASSPGFLQQEAIENNMLHGALVDTDLTSIIQNDTENEYYMLKDGQFVRATHGTLKAGKAYLKVPKGVFTASTNVKVAFEDEGDDEATSIQTVNMETKDNVWYTLEGIKTTTPKKGLYIKNGKKYIIK